MVALVSHHFLNPVDVHFRLLFRRLLGFSLYQPLHRFTRVRQGFLHRRGVALIGRLQGHRDHRPGLHIYSVLGFMCQVRAAILHLGDPRIHITGAHPIFVATLLLSLPVYPRQVFSRRSGNP